MLAMNLKLQKLNGQKIVVSGMTQNKK
jgi:hypothetical protein